MRPQTAGTLRPPTTRKPTLVKKKVSVSRQNKTLNSRTERPTLTLALTPTLALALTLVLALVLALALTLALTLTLTRHRVRAQHGAALQRQRLPAVRRNSTLLAH